MKLTSIEKDMIETYQNVCKLSDLKKICKSRGFNNPPQKGKKDDFAHYVQLRILSESGLEEAFSQLDDQPLLALHLLKLEDEPLSLSEFYPIFNLDVGYYASASSIKGAFETIKERLICKGLALLHFNEYSFRGNSKWNKYCLVFPKEFYDHLPPLPIPTVAMNTPGKFASWSQFMGDNIRRNLLKHPIYFDFKEIKLPKVNLSDGELRLNNNSYPTAEYVHKSLKKSWLLCKAPVNKKSSTYTKYEESDDQIKLRVKTREYILKSIPKGHGITKEDFAIYCKQLNCDFKEKELDVFIESGILFGFLAKQKHNNKEILMVNLDQSQTESADNTMSLKEEKGSVRVSLKSNYNLEDLLTLSGISSLSVDKFHIYITPSIKEIGKKISDLHALPIIKQLLSLSSIYLQAFKTVQKKSGKLTLHIGLNILKLNSIDIKSVLLSSFSDKMIDLGEDYYAVSEGDLPEILKHGKKKGFAPKIIEKHMG